MIKLRERLEKIISDYGFNRCDDYYDTIIIQRASMGFVSVNFNNRNANAS